MFFRISSGNKEDFKLKGDTYKRSEEIRIPLTPFCRV